MPRSQHVSRALVLLQLRTSLSSSLDLSATGGTAATRLCSYMNSWSPWARGLRKTLRRLAASEATWYASPHAHTLGTCMPSALVSPSHLHQDQIDGRAARLWLNGLNWYDNNATASGYRFLTALPSCPRRMRVPMSAQLYRSSLMRAAETGQQSAKRAVRRLQSPSALALKL
jgi:hypothetical protein